MTSEQWIEDIKTSIRRRRLDALKRTSFDVPKVETRNWPWQAPSYYRWMATWSEDAKVQIASAIAKGAAGRYREIVEWDVTLYAWMESAAMYLRDWPTTLLATQASRANREEEAVRLLRWTDEEIQNIAGTWGPHMHYVTICDLMQDSPVSDPTLDGPYCGAFFCTDPENPFVGLVFKGTHPESWQELLVDLHYPPVRAENGHVWGTQVSHGVYSTLFEPFAVLSGQSPFEYIKYTVCTMIAERIHAVTNSTVRLHITGHSLGASYAALSYAELLRLYNNAPIAPLSSGPPTCVLRDLYSFGCPRFGLADFADVFTLAMDEHEGSCWRILARDDPVGLVPPVLITDAKFIHLDRAYEVSDSESPTELPSERNSHPRPPLPVVSINMSNHTPWAYFNALHHAATQLSPKVR
ncbi:hypothetical protein PHLGIDRAFT_239316 [Phlebiopsis gigantea 11061_1 CR5-6]|uniref:Fungal lipase-type domain-containing protein n=1 Tax=Phlebiopsis gigantea (strain 11061_1 CR5-6) TaxID=745531 RepID=A0A0C3S3Z5_PHLG1|nr:hypothetical protein PHLGIDRAFT_239316 [Phlebiopsis gigantea 11061_1 CR5-6]